MRKNLTFLGRLLNAFERRAQQCAQNYLLGLSDRHLGQLGLSRQLIKQGPGVWPWRQAADPLPVPGLSTAMRELNTHNGGKTLNPPRTCPLIAHQARYNDAETSDKLAA